MLGDIVLKTVFLAGMVGFHQFQLGYLNVEIHLLLYIRVSGSQCFHLREYAGFKMAVSFDSFNHKFVMNLKGQLSHNLEIGSDPLGNIARINHALVTVFISLHISTSAVPASFLSVYTLSPTFIKNCSLSAGRFAFAV